MTELADLLLPLSHWSWWIAALILMLLELAVPGVAFLWLGIAAGIVGVLVFFVPAIDWKGQLAIYAVLSVASVVLSRRYLKWKPLETDRPTLNRRGESYIGREFVLDQDIVGGKGHLRVDDTRWQVRGPDRAAGRRVRVVDVDGATMTVADAAEPAENAAGRDTGDDHLVADPDHRRVAELVGALPSRGDVDLSIDVVGRGGRRGGERRDEGEHGEGGRGGEGCASHVSPPEL